MAGGGPAAGPSTVCRSVARTPSPTCAGGECRAAVDDTGARKLCRNGRTLRSGVRSDTTVDRDGSTGAIGLTSRGRSSRRGAAFSIAGSGTRSRGAIAAAPRALAAAATGGRGRTGARRSDMRYESQGANDFASPLPGAVMFFPVCVNRWRTRLRSAPANHFGKLPARWPATLWRFRAGRERRATIMR